MIFSSAFSDINCPPPNQGDNSIRDTNYRNCDIAIGTGTVGGDASSSTVWIDRR